MKKNIIIFLGVIILLLGCNRQKSVNQPIVNPTSISMNVDFENPYDWVGILHNEGLDYIMPLLSKIDNPKIGDIKNATINFIYSIQDTLVEKGWEPPYEWEIDDSYISYCINYTDSTVQPFFIWYSNFLDSCNSEDLVSQEFVEYSKNIFRITSIGDLIGLKDISEEIYNSNLSEYELTILLSEISVAKYSWYYWNNLSKITLGYVGYVLVADLSGAVIGGIYGWVQGDWEDWVDAGVDILGGAVSFSAAAALAPYFTPPTPPFAP